MVAVIIFTSILFLCKLERSGENDEEFSSDQRHPKDALHFGATLDSLRKKKSGKYTRHFTRV